MDISRWINWDAQSSKDDFWAILDRLDAERRTEQRLARQDAEDQLRRQNYLAAHKIDFDLIAQENALRLSERQAG
jgi:hypothetical protein